MNTSKELEKSTEVITLGFIIGLVLAGIAAFAFETGLGSFLSFIKPAELLLLLAT
jgi:hypothetical protein